MQPDHNLGLSISVGNRFSGTPGTGRRTGEHSYRGVAFRSAHYETKRTSDEVSRRNCSDRLRSVLHTHLSVVRPSTLASPTVCGPALLTSNFHRELRSALLAQTEAPQPYPPAPPRGRNETTGRCRVLFRPRMPQLYDNRPKSTLPLCLGGRRSEHGVSTDGNSSPPENEGVDPKEDVYNSAGSQRLSRCLQSCGQLRTLCPVQGALGWTAVHVICSPDHYWLSVNLVHCSSSIVSGEMV